MPMHYCLPTWIWKSNDISVKVTKLQKIVSFVSKSQKKEWNLFMDQLHKQFVFLFFWLDDKNKIRFWNLAIFNCKMLSQKLFGHTIQLHLIYAILYEPKYMPEFPWIEGNLCFFHFCMMFCNYCKTEFWQKWYFVTKIVLTYCEKKLF